jgi:hypothetical protein
MDLSTDNADDGDAERLNVQTGEVKSEPYSCFIA